MAIQQIGAPGVAPPASEPRKPSPTAPTLAAPKASAGANRPLTEQQLRQIVDEVKKVVDPVAQNLRFSIDNDTGKTIVKVVDAATNEVIRQIPSDEMLAIARAMDRLQGLLLSKKA